MFVVAVVGLGIVIGTASVAADQTPASSLTGEWLVKRGRTYALLSPGPPTIGDVEQVLTWMDAAARLAPDLADAYLGQYDMLTTLGRGAEAQQALGAYVARNPVDVAAAMTAFDHAFRMRQSVEGRQALCEEWLAGKSIAPEFASDLHRRLARIFSGRADVESARSHVQEALRLYPGNAAARAVANEMDGTTDLPANQVRALLDAIAAAPARGRESWDLALLLDSLAMHAEAQEWYQHAEQMLRRLDPGGAVPPMLLLDRARSLHDAGEGDAAGQATDIVLQADPDLLEARFLQLHLATESGRTEEAAAVRRTLREYFDRRHDEMRGLRDASSLARGAWFHLENDPDPERAAALVESALSIAPADPVVRRVRGILLLDKGEYRAAIEVLTPLAAVDQLAATGLARALWLAGDGDRAVTVLRRAEKLRYTGMAHEQIVTLLRQAHQEPQDSPDHPDVTAALERFDRTMLSFPLQPARYLEVTTTYERSAWRCGDPWRCTFTVINRGPFPITFGSERMVSPGMVVSLEVSAGSSASTQRFEHYLRLPLAGRPVLRPGERYRVTHRLDVGPVARLPVWRPQQDLTLTLQFVFDPAPDGTEPLESRLSGFQVPAVRIHRQRLQLTRQSLAAWVNRARRADEAQRITALDVLGALVAERIEHLRGELDYRIHRADFRMLADVILGALRDPSPLVRAHAIANLPQLPADEKTINAAAPAVSDSHWLVRLVGLDTLAAWQGPEFAVVVARLEAKDEDPLVRRLATLYLQRWRAAAGPNTP